ncbi:MAG: 1,6-anhydro-N-acetylmuramyl-L-alanine amidase AmpD [Chromatiales bacterium]|nr:1,6-anhydro-N-acetylmuramyl-L-alanine amidase AmpD [Gammaproteobacteria bacterium]MBW6475460.1 1,6-anhydro-N-acetylmuramyl-L-alanine amidase AmpD [Chromatiales bacterium]
MPGFDIDSHTGLLRQARQCPSPNCDARPEACQPELLVIHGISLPPGEYGGAWIDRLFQNRLPADAHPYFAGIAELRVSSHLLIRRDGELVQYVPFQLRAWHAGVSSYQGRERCNDFSIGIELEGQDHDPYTRVQYEQLAAVIIALEQAYPGIDHQRMAGHSDIAPGRKSDPGPAFSWGYLNEKLTAEAQRRRAQE